MRRRRGALLVLSLTGSLTVVVCCGYPRLPHPTYVRQTPSSLIMVPYPPPPARVEFVPNLPHADARWVDGEWVWRGRQWAWRRGRWVIPAPGTAFSPRTLVRNSAGTLYSAEGRWRDAKSGADVLPPPVLAHGKASPDEVTDLEDADAGMGDAG